MGKAGLSLSGPSLIVYAIIYGFSQDGVTSCRCHLSYFQEWADVCERTARSIISDLARAGYIRRIALGEGRGALVEYRANLEIASKAQKGAKFAPINKGANISDKGAKSCTKGGKICRQDNNIIIYKNIFFQAREDSLATEKGRKEEIYKLFFFKNSTSPNVEVEEFYRVNVLNDWKDGKGAKMDTSMSKLLAWADGWNLKGGSNRTNSYFLNAWREIYNDAIARFDPMAKRLLDPRIKCDSDSQQVLITAPKPLVSWLEKYLVEGNNRIADVMRGFCRGRKLMYNLLES